MRITHKPTRWQRIRLWFCPLRVSVDAAANGWTSEIHYKVMGGDLYIVAEHAHPPDCLL